MVRVGIVLLGFLAVFAAAAPSSLLSQQSSSINLADDIESQVKSIRTEVSQAVLLATKALAQSKVASEDQGSAAVEAQESVAGVLGLVENMIAQLGADSAADVDEELNLRSAEEAVESAAQQALASSRVDLQEHTAIHAAVLAQRDASAAIIDNSTAALTAVQSSLSSHLEVCEKHVPDLQQRIRRINGDLALLGTLKARLDQVIADSNSTDTSSYLAALALLPQISHSLKALSTHTHNHTTDTSSDDDGKTDVEKMHDMLWRLTSELEAVKERETREIEHINTTCTEQEHELVDAKAELEERLRVHRGVVNDRTAQLVNETASIAELEQSIADQQGRVVRLQRRMEDRMRIYLTLMKRRQLSMLILSEMQRELRAVADRLALAVFPDLTAPVE